MFDEYKYFGTVLSPSEPSKQRKIILTTVPDLKYSEQNTLYECEPREPVGILTGFGGGSLSVQIFFLLFSFPIHFCKILM